jgi:hypothetical protein
VGGHDPAALVFAFVNEVEGVALFKLFEGGGPELEVEDFAFAGEDIVGDAETPHGGEVAFDDGVGDEVAELGEFAFAVFDGVEGIATPLDGFGVGGVVSGSAGVEVPAVVVEAGGGGEGGDFVEGFLSRWWKPTTTSATWTPVLSM